MQKRNETHGGRACDVLIFEPADRPQRFFLRSNKLYGRLLFFQVASQTYALRASSVRPTCVFRTFCWCQIGTKCQFFRMSQVRAPYVCRTPHAHLTYLVIAANARSDISYVLHACQVSRSYVARTVRVRESHETAERTSYLIMLMVIHSLCLWGQNLKMLQIC